MVIGSGSKYSIDCFLRYVKYDWGRQLTREYKACLYGNEVGPSLAIIPRRVYDLMTIIPAEGSD